MKKKSSKKRRRKLSIYKIFGLFLFIMSLIVFGMLKVLDILPSKYLLFVFCGFLIINFCLDIFLFRKKTKRYKKNIALFLSFVLIVLLFFPIFYVKRTMNFMNSIVAVDYKLENYSVIVLKDSKYNNINDIKNLSIGIYENVDGVKKAKKELLKKVDVTFDGYDSLESISNDLINDKIDIIVLEDSILSMVKEDNVDFENLIKVIYNFKVKIKSDNEAKDVNVVNESFNIYLTGIDTFGDISSVSRSDVNIVMTVNPQTKQVLLTSIPRDYYVELHGKKGSRDKLTHAGIYGTDMSISTIEDLLGIDINYYFKVNFTSFIDIINTLGGIEAYSKYSFTSIDGYKYNEGYNKMNGEEALSFARERKAFAEGDRQRGADQQAVIEAVIKKMSSNTILKKYDSLLNSIEGKFQTNMDAKTIKSLIKMQLSDMASWNVKSISLDGSNGRGITYSGGNQELYVMIPDWDTVDEASSTIKAVFDGKKLDESFVANKSDSTRVIKSYGVSGSIVIKNNNETNNEEKDNKKLEDNDDKVEEKIIVEEDISDDDSDEKIVEIKIDNSDNLKDNDKNNNVDDEKSDGVKDEQQTQDKDSDNNDVIEDNNGDIGSDYSDET